MTVWALFKHPEHGRRRIILIDALGTYCAIGGCRERMLVVSAMDRRELDELCRSHDRMMDEAREARGASDDIVFKVTERVPEVAVYTEPPEPVEDGDDSIRDLINAVQAFQGAVSRRIDDFDRQLIELRGKVDTLVAVLAGGKSKSADVVELPDWRRPDVA